MKLVELAQLVAPDEVPTIDDTERPLTTALVVACPHSIKATRYAPPSTCSMCLQASGVQLEIKRIASRTFSELTDEQGVLLVDPPAKSPPSPLRTTPKPRRPPFDPCVALAAVEADTRAEFSKRELADLIGASLDYLNHCSHAIGPRYRGRCAFYSRENVLAFLRGRIGDVN